MRITQGRLIEIVSTSIGRARDKTGEASIELSSGISVARPSDDAAAWATGMAKQAAITMSGAQGKSIQRATDRLNEQEAAFSDVHSTLLDMHQLAVQLANEGYSPEDRANAAASVRTLRDDMLSVLNRRAVDGEYIFAGDAGDAAPFDATGAYVGGAASRQVQVGQRANQLIALDVSSLGPANGGFDVIGALDRFATALEANDGVAVSAVIDELQNGANHIADLRSQAGYTLNALDHAEDARGVLEDQLKTEHQRLLEADPIAAATRLAQAQSSFDAAGAVAQRVLGMLQNINGA